MVKYIKICISSENFILTINDGSEKVFNLKKSFEIFKANSYFKSLTSGIVVQFISFKQYFKLIKDIAKIINVPVEVTMG